MIYVKYKDSSIYVRINSLIFLFSTGCNGISPLITIGQRKKFRATRSKKSSNRKTSRQRQIEYKVFARQRMDKL